MACKKERVPFSGTPEQEAALKKVIAQLKDTKGALMPIMQQAQEIYGYLPIEVQTMISDETGIPLELYFFSANKVWVAYEGIQADVFDHVLAIIPEFGLRVFQNPSGEDLRRIGVKIEH